MVFFKSRHIIRNFFEISYLLKKHNYEYLGRYFILRKPYYVWKETKPLKNLRELLKPHHDYKKKGNIIILYKVTNDEYYNREECWKFNKYIEKGNHE